MRQATATKNWYDANAKTLYVDSVSDLAAFSQAGATNTFSGQTVMLTKDIDMAGYEWTQIPKFCGTLDGQGFAIKNLSMSGVGDVAFINELNNATVKNIQFIGGTFTANGTTGPETPETDGDDAAVVAVVAKGTCYFQNIYTKATVNNINRYRASGLLSYVDVNHKAVFENCVSACTVNVKASTGRGSGILAQIMRSGTAEMTNCAFIGDISNAGQVSGGLAGCVTGNVTLKNCVSLGKGSSNAYSGLLIFLDHQNALNASYTSNVKITDCYAAASGSIRPVGVHSARSAYFNVDFECNGTMYDLTNASDSTSVNATSINPSVAYLANGTTKNLTKANFATNYASLAEAGWTLVDGEDVAYGVDADMKLPLILPKNVAAMMNGSFRTPVEGAYWQAKDDGDGYDLRFVSRINFEELSDYNRVGFKVSVKIKGASDYLIDGQELSTTTVLTSITADGLAVQASSLNAKYLYALQVQGFKDSNVYEITLLSFAEMKDGSVIYNYDNQTTLTMQNGAIQ